MKIELQAYGKRLTPSLNIECLTLHRMQELTQGIMLTKVFRGEQESTTCILPRSTRLISSIPGNHFRTWGPNGPSSSTERSCPTQPSPTGSRGSQPRFRRHPASRRLRNNLHMIRLRLSICSPSLAESVHQARGNEYTAHVEHLSDSCHWLGKV